MNQRFVRWPKPSRLPPPPSSPVPLTPQQRRAWILRDRTLQGLEILLDEFFRIPGTPIRFGLDAILGIIPLLGDVLAGVLSLVIPFAAWTRGIPYATLARMLANLAIGVLVGSIPVFGDIFDVFWKANRRNYRLLQQHIQTPRRQTARDWIYLAILALAIMGVFAMPIAALVWVVSWFLHHVAQL